MFSGPGEFFLAVFAILAIFLVAYAILIFLPRRKRDRLSTEAVAFRARKNHLDACRKLLAAYSVGVTWYYSPEFDRQREILKYLTDSFEKLGKEEMKLDGATYTEKDVLKMVRDYGRSLIDRSFSKDVKSEPQMRPITLKSVVCPICMTYISKNELVSKNKRWHCPVCDLPIFSHLPGGLDSNVF